MNNSMDDRFAKLRLFSLEWGAKKGSCPDLTKWRSRLKLDNVELLYVLGLGDGSPYFSLQSWLAEKKQRRLVFLEKEGSAIGSLFEENHPLLSDPQVDLEWLGSEDTLSELAERYPVQKVEVVQLPGVRDPKIRLKLLRKTMLSYSLYQDRLYSYQHFEHFLRNVPRLKGAFYANALKGAFSGATAVVCGAGPSLQAAIGLIKQLQRRALIIAGGSAVAALSAQGIIPHFALAIDPNYDEYLRFRNSFAFECPLLFSTRLHHAVFATCSGPFGYLRSGFGGAPELWLDKELGIDDPLLGKDLDDESASVTPVCIAFAQLLGCSAIALSGVDLAYAQGKRYAEGVSGEKTDLQSIEAEKNVADRILLRKDKHGSPIFTALRWIMEENALSRLAKKHPEIRWINTSEGGLPIRNFETMSLADAIEAYCPHRIDFRTQIARLIADHPMPDPSGKLEELEASLLRVISHLEILAGEKKGSKALAEIELQEELATKVLFYDIERMLSFQEEENRWPFYLSHARKHRSAV